MWNDALKPKWSTKREYLDKESAEKLHKLVQKINKNNREKKNEKPE